VRKQLILFPASRVRAAVLVAAEAVGHGCPGEQELSVSLAAMAWRRTRVPSRQRRVSPSFT